MTLYEKPRTGLKSHKKGVISGKKQNDFGSTMFFKPALGGLN